MHSTKNPATLEQINLQSKRVRFEDNTATSSPFGNSAIKTEDEDTKPKKKDWNLEKKRIMKLYTKSYKEDEGPTKKRYYARKTVTPSQETQARPKGLSFEERMKIALDNAEWE